jgi:hypothetical protein
VWLSVLIARRPGRRIRDRVPPGYTHAVVGLVAFAVGGVGDSAWHTVLGVEVGIDALLSPTHLLLMAGMMAIVTAPYRAALARGVVGKRGLPLVSLGVGVALAGFFLNFVWGLGDGGFRVPYNPADGVGELAVIAGVASVLVTTVVSSAAVLLALRLGKPRFGAFTLLFGLVAAAVHVAFDEESVGIVAALAAGIVLDSILGRPRSGARIAVALPAATAVLWGVYFGVPALGGDMQWPAEIWMGSVVLAILGAGVLAHLGSYLSADPGGSTPRAPSADRAARLAPAADHVPR